MKILVVEDHADTAHMLARVLREWGYEPTVAASAAEALRRCDETTFDLILCDIVLGPDDGWELVKQLREHCATKAIALSGLGQADDVEKSRAAGFAAHLVKPVDMELLRETIQAVVRE